MAVMAFSFAKSVTILGRLFQAATSWKDVSGNGAATTWMPSDARGAMTLATDFGI